MKQAAITAMLIASITGDNPCKPGIKTEIYSDSECQEAVEYYHVYGKKDIVESDSC